MTGWPAPRRVVAWAAAECERQQSGEMSVLRVLEAWDYASHRPLYYPTVEDVLHVGHLIEPDKNRPTEFRHENVYIRNTLPGAHQPGAWQDVPRLVETLVNQIGAYRTTPEGVNEWYYEFERIHPFVDGNGRAGSVLRAWLLGPLALAAPTAPPNMFAGSPR
jgi:hypothetical protein